MAAQEAAQKTAAIKHEAEEVAKAAAAQKQADELAAQKAATLKREAEAAQAAARKQAEDAALKLAADRKHAEEVAAQRAIALKREADEVARAAAAREQAEELAAKQSVERKRVEEAEIARLVAEKKRIEQETARIAAENQKKLEQEKARAEADRKIAELDQARIEAEKVAAAKRATMKLPDLLSEEPSPASKGVALVTEKTLVLNETDLALENGEPTERNYNLDYVPKSIVEIKKRYVVPTETPKRPQVVAETIDIDPPVAPKKTASLQSAETVDLPPPVAIVEASRPIGPLVTHVNDGNFAAEVENYKGAILIDFSATWCGPCQRLAPVIDDLAAEFRGKVKVVKIDVDQAPNAARKYGAYSIPLLVIVKNGRTVDSRVGAQPREYIQSWMQNNADAPVQIETPTRIESAPKPKSLGMNLIPADQRTIVSDVGTLDRIDIGIEGVKYILRNAGKPLRFIIEPSDVDMSPMVGRTISITGTSIGRSYSDVSVIQMKSASTFG